MSSVILELDHFPACWDEVLSPSLPVVAMVATTFMWVLDRNILVTRSIYVVKASNQDQALMMDIRKKVMTNNTSLTSRDFDAMSGDLQ